MYNIWKRHIKVEQFRSVFHSCLDKFATFNIDNNLKGHILLLQVALQPHDRNMLVGTASGNYDIKAINTATISALQRNQPT